ncbi:hypothetical protein CGG79_06590 [Vibrio parahaemolyticus]|uniref:glycosyltransferase family 2 protein n=1 Tax=Vibrio parahaemolyticus TaxID=670 RepID=UPI001122B19A|nr:glycosyltransferase family 2 protein [Vibrio parahaemolyticus]MBE3773230.1 glycosyltransferase family 2 protein [Vibrio parahaemolyticus]TOQ45385.1 hypothetical protein CGG95_08505 [Vibrio parahaemolyticus]TOR33821.1 hypothetical protein CGG79_06590 [Vibrio parahaemolyticus]HBH7886275.1 glycosyltransferase family 2 protein [Vibrio parahaemolyticus]HCE4560108.1 glycosyltransferase family 2 protein [Vibrio parahaemolyticus]
MTKVSVIIPVYNGREVVIDAVNSALQQQEVIEVICVNDGSTDDTKKILESIENPKFRFYNIKNSGASFARNFGAQKARGDYLAFLDADDYFLQNRFCRQLPEMLHENKKLSISSILVTKMDNSFVCNFSKKKFSRLSRNYKVKSVLSQLLTMNTPTIIIEKEFFLSLGGFDTNLKLREDHKFLIEALRKDDMHIEPSSPVVRRQYESSSTSSVSMDSLVLGNNRFHESLSSLSTSEALLSNISLFHVCLRRFGARKVFSAKPDWLKFLLLYPFYIILRAYFK